MFAKERDWAANYGIQIKDASEKFSAVANARLRLIQQMGHLAGALSITVAGKNAIVVNARPQPIQYHQSMPSLTLSRSTKTVKIMKRIIVHHEGRVLFNHICPIHQEMREPMVFTTSSQMDFRAA